MLMAAWIAKNSETECRITYAEDGGAVASLSQECHSGLGMYPNDISTVSRLILLLAFLPLGGIYAT